MKEQLIKLANEKCFLSKLSIILSGIDYIPKTIEKYIEDIEHYLWMCELQKWLMDTYDIYVNSYPYQIPELYFGSDIIKFNGITLDLLNQTLHDETYEQALEKGLFEALKLIK